MTEPVFTKEVYPHNQFLNPCRSKLKTLFLRKSRIEQQSQQHNRTLSLDRQQHQHECCCSRSEGQCVQQLKQMLVGNTALLKQLKQFLTAQTPHAVLAPSVHHLQLMQQKTTLLESEIRSKDQRMDSLRQRYDELLNKFQNFTTHSKYASINTSFDSNTNRSLSASRKCDILKQLKRLRERLKNLDFSGVIRVINRIGRHQKA